MGRKDIADRLYFSDCRRFAELMNAVLYHGENVLLPENLSLIRRKYPFYKTDLNEFFQAIQCRGNKVKLRELFRTEAFRYLGPETEQVIARHLHIERLAHKMEKEGLSMCKAFDDLADELLQEGKTAGLKEGRREGRREEKIRIIRQMIKEGLDEAFIHRMTRCTAEEFSTAKR